MLNPFIYGCDFGRGKNHFAANAIMIIIVCIITFAIIINQHTKLEEESITFFKWCGCDLPTVRYVAASGTAAGCYDSCCL